MDKRTKLSYKLLIFLSIYFIITSILMVFYFLEFQKDIQDDSKYFLVYFYGISIFIFIFLAIFSYYGLKGKRIRVKDNIVGSVSWEITGLLGIHGLGIFLHIGLPFFILIDIEGLGYYQRLMIMFFFLSFWIVVLYFILKIRYYKKPERKRR